MLLYTVRMHAAAWRRGYYYLADSSDLGTEAAAGAVTSNLYPFISSCAGRSAACCGSQIAARSCPCRVTHALPVPADGLDIPERGGLVPLLQMGLARLPPHLHPTGAGRITDSPPALTARDVTTDQPTRYRCLRRCQRLRA